ncbi:MAG TPA: ABC transporter permease, partial [Gemmatimonadaceae bacterium]
MSDFDGPRRGFRRLLRLPGHRAQQIAREVDDELRFHLDMRAAELEAAGLSPDAARREAERRFGNLSDTQEYCRMMDRESARRERRRDWFADAWDDARWTVRQMARYPGFTLLAVITLAVGIGASTAIYSVVHRLLIDPLPLPGGERMVVLVRQSPTSPLKLTPSPQLIEAWRSVRSFEWVAALDQRHVVLGEGTDTATVTGGGFETAVPQRLRIRPVLGRFFADDEALPGAAPVAMLGYGLWQRRFGGDPGVIGRAVHIDGRPHTVIGVTPPEFELPFFSSTPESKDIWTPLVLDTTTVGVNGMAMLRPGATAEQAGHEMTAIMHDLGANDPLSRGLVAAALRPQDFLRSSTREMLLVTLGAVGVLLLIACTNVANLLLARSIGRQRELAVRQALGAGRGRLVRQLLTESGILSLAGGALGLWVAWRALAAIIALRPEELVALNRVRLDAGMLVGALVVAVVTGILFGLAPALLATDGGIGQALRQGTSGDGGHRRSTRLRSTFVTLEIALSVVLLVGAGLLVRS